jgi:hypothetical protein
VVRYQNLMRAGYRRLWLEYQIKRQNDPCDIATFIDQFATYAHIWSNRWSVH